MRYERSKINSIESPLQKVQNDILRWSEERVAIQNADPLSADGFLMFELPRLNNAKDAKGIAHATKEFIPSPAKIQTYSKTEARAATRDLGFMTLSFVHHGGELPAIPALEGAFLALRKKTGDVPSATMDHYETYNPQDKRMRTFTGTDDEKKLITKTYAGMQDLPRAVVALSEAIETSIYDLHYASHIQKAVEHYSPIVEGNKAVRKEVSLDVFTKEIQPYFVTLPIGDKKYAGPGGAQISTVLEIDKLLGIRPKPVEYRLTEYDEVLGVTFAEEYSRFTEYVEDNIQYASSEVRSFDTAMKTKLPLIDAAIQASSTANEKTEQQKESAKQSINALRKLHKQILLFRAPHLAMAKESLKKREKKSGSGGYDQSMLTLLIRETLYSRDQLEIAAKNLGIPKSTYT